MKAVAASAVVGAALLLPLGVTALPPPERKLEARYVDTKYPYKGPKVPVGDWVDNTVPGNGKGFPRLSEPPAVKPSSKTPSNNVNVISVSYIPNGVNIHFSTPFGLTADPVVKYGKTDSSLTKTATGTTETYDRTPACDAASVLLCNMYFHNIQISGLDAATTYYYEIPAQNGTTVSDVLSFTTARTAGDTTAFTMAVLNDMGYTNAKGTHKMLLDAVKNDDVAFAWHGGDLSYADDWYDGILECESDWDVCYNGSDSSLPGGITKFYKDHPLPKGEIPDQGGPDGGDFSPIYETNWDLWQQWMNVITKKVPYMTAAGNHEAACAEFDGDGAGTKNTLTAYLNHDKVNASAKESDLTYYSCPPSQRNFTAYSNRFRMPGSESSGVSNFWYSFDYGVAHFVTITTETDFPYSPEYPFIRDTDGNGTQPTPDETYVTDSGPFGYITDNDYDTNTAYEQYQWLKADLKAVDKTKTPWIIVMGHRPMYSSQTSSYQANIRDAFEDLMVNHDVDVYLAGHIHWYERMYPLKTDGSINEAAVVSNHTYKTDPGVSMVHLTNGMAGNIESHSTLGDDPRLNITAALNQYDYGFNKVHITEDKLLFEFIKGDGSGVGDHVTIEKSSTASRRSSLGYE